MNVSSPFQDYRAPAFYLVTMVALNRRLLFATCEDNQSILNRDGRIVHDRWKAIPQTYPAVQASTLCVWRRDALKKYTRYIQDNLRRYCLKKDHPELFKKVSALTHPCLPGDARWSGYGNRFLLERPEKCAVRFSRNASPNEIADRTREILAEARRGVVIVSPFISSGEKAVANAILDAPIGDVILLKPDGVAPMFKPKGRYFDLCAQGRLLVLAANLAPEPSITRETCLTLNAFCTEIAQKESGVNACSTVGYTVPASAFTRA